MWGVNGTMTGLEQENLSAGPDASEFEEALDRRAPYDQRVFAAYEVDSGFVRPRGAPVRWYFPMTAAAAVGELARVGPGNERDALRFVRRWGLLGWYGIKHGEGGGADSGGDPLPWIWAHANGVRVALELCRLLRRDDEARMECYFDSLTVTDGQAGAAVRLGGILHQASPHVELSPAAKAEIVSLGALAFGAPAGGEDYGFVFGNRDGVVVLRTDGNPEEPFSSVARRLVANIVNPHLGGVFPALAHVYPEFEHRSEGVLGLKLHYRFDSLVSVCYRLIAEIALNGRVVECRECGSPFVQKDRRQQFCPPPWGRESRCANRYHKRIQRAKK
jgi:hypothetical protein